MLTCRNIKFIFKFNRYTGEVGRFAQHLSQPNVGLFNHIRGISVVHGNLKDLSPKVSVFVVILKELT